jgi:hypothetical protein
MVSLSGSSFHYCSDPSKYTGKITYVPITGTSPANKYWGIDQAITYGSAGVPILSSTAGQSHGVCKEHITQSIIGIVDTGTSLILIATDAYNRYAAATGGTKDQATGRPFHMTKPLGLLTRWSGRSSENQFFAIRQPSEPLL